jgi:carbamoyl-phosphate synthase large subunit
VLVDFRGQTRCIVPRLRIDTRAGEVSKAVTVKAPLLIEWAQKVVSALPGAVGCITVQCFKQPNGEVKFIEINPRFGGGFPLSAEAGANYPLWIIRMLEGNDGGMGW